MFSLAYNAFSFSTFSSHIFCPLWPYCMLTDSRHIKKHSFWTVPISSINFHITQNVSTHNVYTLNMPMGKMKISSFVACGNPLSRSEWLLHYKWIEIDLCNLVDLVHSEREYVSGLCYQSDSFEASARKTSPTEFYEGDTQEVTRQKATVWISTVNCLAQLRFSPLVFTPVIDRLLAELDRRYNSYQDVEERFSF